MLAELLLSGKENVTIESESLVHVPKAYKDELSRAGHEKSCLNMGGPSSKAKYYLRDR